MKPSLHSLLFFAMTLISCFLHLAPLLFLHLCLLHVSPVCITAQLEYGNASSTVPIQVPLSTSLSPDSNPTVLISQNGLFQVEFRAWLDSGVNYCMAGVKYMKKSPGGVIWSFSNEQEPVMGSSCTLKLGEDGVLSMQHDANHVVAWQTQTAGLGVQNLILGDDGNLVLEGGGGQILWQSFDQSPIFILPSGMHFTQNTTLFFRQHISAVPDFSTPGMKYALQLSQQGRLVLTTTANGSMFVYHSLGVIQSSKADYVVLGDAIQFYDNQATLIGSIDYNLAKPNSSLMISGFVDVDSNLIINYWNGSHNAKIYNSSLSTCEMPFTCGEYGLCDEVLNECSCPSGFKQASDGGKDCKASDPKYNLSPINVAFHPQLSPFLVKSQDECSTKCAQNSTCNAALFDSSTTSCALFPILYTIRTGENNSQVMFLKIPGHDHSMTGTIIGTIVGISVLLCLTCWLLVFFVRRRRRRNTSKHDELFLHDLPRLPPRFTYRDLQVATKDFSTKLGAGGFGTVYEGVLSATGVKVAVKKLDQVGAAQSMDQFRAEVASIGSVSHVNLVTLKGFCMEGASRLLVYEFMARGSLDRWLFGAGKDEEGVVLDWETRCRIALDTARGLEYLHHQCLERIVHCDVKPENILLDDKFNAKVADFGLAKLIGSDNQSFAMTTLKGTRGYLAPEWLQHATITAKSDVYSYGVVLLELITGHKCLDAERGYLPTWAMSIATSATSTSSSGGGDDVQASIDIPRVEEVLLDERLRGSVPTSSLQRMVMVALGSVQSDPAARPTMASVVQMLAGLVEVAPLRPFSSLHSSCPSPYDGVSEAYALISPLVPDAQNRSDSLTDASSTRLFPPAQAC